MHQCRLFAASTPQIFTSVVTFAVFAAQPSAEFTINKVLTSLSIITLVTQPATQLLSAITDSPACLGCFARIQAYLLTPSFDDARSVLGGVSSALQNECDSDFGDSRSKSHELQVVQPRKRAPARSSRSATAIDARIDTLRPAADSPFAVTGLHFHLASGQLASIMGPVGSGKSTILRAILSEVRPEKGSIHVSDKRIAYCAQDPWIMSATLQ